MCLAIYKPAGKYVNTEHLENGYHNHNDGCGIAWAKDGQLHVKKGLYSFKDFLEIYNEVKEYACLIHFRKSTHGKINEENCHPFLFDDGKYAMIHNGVLPIKCSIDGLSDTAHFVKLVLEPMVQKFNVPIDSGALHYLICTSIGSDKMAVMDGNGDTILFNEDKGTKEGEVWYSNCTFRYAYKAKTTYTYPATVKTGNTGHRSQSLDEGSNYGHSSHTSSNISTNWRKNWNHTDESNERYLAFWKSVRNEQKQEDSAIRHLLTEGNDTQIIDAEEVDQTVDGAGNVLNVEKNPAEGQQTEYGWFDETTEQRIKNLRMSCGCNRQEALIRIFTEK